MNPAVDAPLIVADTMVVVAAVIGNPNGSSASLADEVSSGGVRLAISDAQLSELVRVIGYPEVEDRTRRTVRAFEVALDIGYMGIAHHPRRPDWPSLSDPKDYWVFDLAYAADADYIVSYDGAVQRAADALGFECMTPEEPLRELRKAP